MSRPADFIKCHETETNETDSLFGFYISQINRAAQSFFVCELKSLGVGPGEQAYLLCLQPREEIIQEELALRLKVDRANVTRAVHSLEKKGLLLRSPDPDDKRKKYVSLSEEGIAIRNKVEKISKQWIEKLKAPLSEEKWTELVESLALISLSFSD